jgi:hypothetical protein
MTIVLVALAVLFAVTFCGVLIFSIVGMICLTIFDKVSVCIKALRRRFA